MLREEYSVLLPYIYNEENIDAFVENYCSKLIDKLLIDQTDQSKYEIMQFKRNENSVRVNSMSNYLIQNE